MQLNTFNKGDLIHKKGDSVIGLDVVLAGSLSVVDGNYSLTCATGSILGVAEQPRGAYRFNYTALETCKIATYFFDEGIDIEKVIRTNPKIATVLSMSIVKRALTGYGIYDVYNRKIRESYDNLKKAYENYPKLCMELGESMGYYPGMDELKAPVISGNIQSWMKNYLEALVSKEALYKKNVDSIGMDIIIGISMSACDIYRKTILEYEALRNYESKMVDASSSFKSHMLLLENRMKAMRSEDDGQSDDLIPDFSHSLDTILIYADQSAKDSEKMKELINEYTAYGNRTGTSDDLRRLRRDITENFFALYEKVYFKSRKDNPVMVPAEIKMFLMFGFLTEELAGKDNTVMLYRLSQRYRPDPRGITITIPEWLDRIHEGKNMPSKNEFELDYPGQLKEWRGQGDITPEEEARMLNDADEKVRFEIRNFFKVASRMTFGRLTTFIPVFDEVNVVKPIDTAYIKNTVIHDQLDAIREVDFSVFVRARDYTNERLDIFHLILDKEVMPYFILVPVLGSRIALWQEIEGKSRGTAARFIAPIFMSDDLEKNILAAVGEYRWEMCKTIQGMYWNDITDPSLTSEYADYIQYYRKNNSLSKDQKDKLGRNIKKYANNLRKIFTADYMTYITREGNGSSVLNKVAREILFKYIPFSAPVRDKLKLSPQYEELIKKHEAQVARKARAVQAAVAKCNKAGADIPDEIRTQEEYLNL